MMNSGYFYLLIIYLVWGTTYLAMRVGVGPDGGFPVFLFGAVRCLAAAALLLGLAKLRGHSLRPSGKQLLNMAFTGLLGWMVAHGLVLYAEQFIDSGFAAVAVSASPLWVLLLASFLERKVPRLLHAVFVLVGFAGVAALIYPTVQDGTVVNLAALIPLLLSPVCWAYATLHIQKHPVGMSTFAVSGYQHLFGGLGFMAMSLLLREPAPHPTPAAWSALLFLVVFGSVIAYTAFIKALSILPVHVVTTNTYVNPVIAVVLGWVILREPVTLWTLLAMGLVTLSVAGILQLNRTREVRPPLAVQAAATTEE